MRHATVLVAILAFVPVAGATAQLRPGERVRVTGHFCTPLYSNCGGGRPEHRVGTFVAWKSDTLVVQSNGDTLQVALMNVTRLDVYMGRKAQAGAGAVVGGLAVVVLLAIAAATCDASFGCPTAGEAAKPLLIGGAAGAFVGASIGAVTNTDRWVEVPLGQLRVSFGPQPDGRIALGLSVRF